MSQPLKRNNPCQAAMAETSACPANIQNQFPAVGMFSHSNVVVREISSNGISQALLLSKTTCWQSAQFSAALCTCKSKGPGIVPQGWAGHHGQALSITHGMRYLQQWPNPNTSLFWDTATGQGLLVLYPGCLTCPRRATSPLSTLFPFVAEQEIFFLYLHCWRVCFAEPVWPLPTRLHRPNTMEP